MWIPAVTLFLLLSYGESQPKKQRVCVIGTGMAGITALKQLSGQIDYFEAIAFEKNSDIGGLWIYTDDTEFDKHGLPVHSRVYKNLRINLPREVLTHPEYRHFDGRENSSYVSHPILLEYLRNYTDQFNLRRYIQFDTLVEKVSPLISDDGDWRKSKWQVETRNLNTNKSNEILCNAVMISNGHYFKANVPTIAGIESFPGRVLHSSSYRRPEDFANLTVLVLGAHQSGMDISRDLSSHVKTVYLSHRHDTIEKDFPSNVQQVKGVVAVDGNRLILQDNSSIFADSFMFCTGYFYDFDFLDESSGIDVGNGKEVRSVYNMIVNIEHPSMGFIGLADMVANPSLFTTQSKYFLDLIRGQFQLPSYDEMKNSKWSKSFYLDFEQWEYMNDLANEAGFPKLPPFYERIYRLIRDLGIHFREDYRLYDIRVINDSEVLAVRRRDGKTGSRWQDFVD